MRGLTKSCSDQRPCQAKARDAIVTGYQRLSSNLRSRYTTSKLQPRVKLSQSVTMKTKASEPYFSVLVCFSSFCQRMCVFVLVSILRIIEPECSVILCIQKTCFTSENGAVSVSKMEHNFGKKLGSPELGARTKN